MTVTVTVTMTVSMASHPVSTAMNVQVMPAEAACVAGLCRHACWQPASPGHQRGPEEARHNRCVLLGSETRVTALCAAVKCSVRAVVVMDACVGSMGKASGRVGQVWPPMSIVMIVAFIK